MQSKKILKFLGNNPEMRKAFEKFIQIAEDREDVFTTGDMTEYETVAAGRELCAITLSEWAKNKAKKRSFTFEKKHPKAHKDQKKK